MEIQNTKYNVNQVVWVMFRNKPVETSVESLKVIVDNDENVEIQYILNLDTNIGYFESNVRAEDELFSSKIQTINSLK